MQAKISTAKQLFSLVINLTAWRMHSLDKAISSLTCLPQPPTPLCECYHNRSTSHDSHHKASSLAYHQTHAQCMQRFDSELGRLANTFTQIGI